MSGVNIAGVKVKAVPADYTTAPSGLQVQSDALVGMSNGARGSGDPRPASPPDGEWNCPDCKGSGDSGRTSRDEANQPDPCGKCMGRGTLDYDPSKPPLPDFETELRKVPGLTEDEIDMLVSMATAGFKYGVELQRRRRARGLVPVCHYTGKACHRTGSSCTCLIPGFAGKPPKDWVPAKG